MFPSDTEPSHLFWREVNLVKKSKVETIQGADGRMTKMSPIYNQTKTNTDTWIQRKLQTHKIAHFAFWEVQFPVHMHLMQLLPCSKPDQSKHEACLLKHNWKLTCYTKCCAAFPFYFRLSVLLCLERIGTSSLMKKTLLIALFYITELPVDAEQHFCLLPSRSCLRLLPCLFLFASVQTCTTQHHVCLLHILHMLI